MCRCGSIGSYEPGPGKRIVSLDIVKVSLCVPFKKGYRQSEK